MLPDFSAMFRRERVEPLRFRSRRGSNYGHDVIFLSSYLHDARFSPGEMTRRGKTVRIAFERDCWELGLMRRQESSEVHIARARLSISPVTSMRWEVEDPSCLARELWVESIYLGPGHWEPAETSELVIAAPHGGWKLIIGIADDFATIRLDDLERPYLFSSRKADRSAE